MMHKALGIDLASANWRSNGSATIEFDVAQKTIARVITPAVTWPTGPLNARAMARAIDAFARKNGISAVALDGPQGWRDPKTPPGVPGVGRRSEYECQTQGKAGVYPNTYPGNQRPWIEFSVDVFSELLANPGVALTDAGSLRAPPTSGYLLLECYPTSAWRSSGLTPLPGKGRNPRLAPYVQSLTNAYQLPFQPPLGFTHDDLQAVVAALTGVAAIGGPAVAEPRGVAATPFTDANGVERRAEGFIWNVRPLGSPVALPVSSRGLTATTCPAVAHQSSAQVYVTQGVLDQVARAGATQAQIAHTGLPSATRTHRRTIVLTVGDDGYEVVLGDTNAIWRAHQTAPTSDSFEALFARLSDQPGTPLVVDQVALAV